MDENQILEFLKDKLSVRVSFDSGGYYNNPEITVELELDDKVISSATCFLDRWEPRSNSW